MLCSNGALVDPPTLDNDTPLSLALQSHMRDTVRKLVHLGAQLDKDLACQYVNRGFLPPDMFSRSFVTDCSGIHTMPPSTQGTNTVTGSPNLVTTTNHHNAHFVCPYEVAVSNSQVLINQLQCQSTSYDLELARRKRELIRRLPSLPGLSSQSMQVLAVQTQRVARADLPLEDRIDAISLVANALPVLYSNNAVHENGLQHSFWSIGTGGEPYLRLYEACMCESHCPIPLAARLSQLCVILAALGDGRSVESMDTNSVDAIVDSHSAAVASYITRLLRKLIAKNNPQYRAGILAHLSRMICCLAHAELSPLVQHMSPKLWSELFACTPTVLSSLVRLGESLDQPSNVVRLAHFIGLIGRRLLEVPSLDSLDSCADRFSDLADILVGWGVDPSSVTRGISLTPIYFELCHGLSNWWLHPPISRLRPVKSEKFSPVVIKSIRQMMFHLMEDSESTLNTAFIECSTILASNRHSVSGSSKSSPDPTGFLIATRLFLSVLSSVATGISLQLLNFKECSFRSVLRLSSQEVIDWVERLLRLIKSAHMCLRSSWPSCPMVLWPSVQPGHSGALHISPSLVDTIESPILDLLFCFLDHDSSDTVVQIMTNFLNSRLLDSAGRLPMSNSTLLSMLRLVHRVVERLPLPTDYLLTYFGSNSLLHTCKFITSTSRNQEPPSSLLMRTLVSLVSLDSCRDALSQLALFDLKQAVNLVETAEFSEPTSAVIAGKCESLGLFGLTLYSTVLKTSSSKAQFSMRCKLFAVMQQNGFSVWNVLPVRLRIAILSLLTHASLNDALSLADITYLVKAPNTQLSSSLELVLIADLISVALNNSDLGNKEKMDYLFRLLELARKALLSNRCLQVHPTSVFNRFTKILLTHGFCDRTFHRSSRFTRRLIQLTQLASTVCHPEVNKLASDLLLALGTSRLASSFPGTPSNILLYYIGQRPDRSSTSLVIPSKIASDLAPSGIVGSASAYPSLPAVAGVLGILTRGAPYHIPCVSSRLKLLEQPIDWIRRLSFLISPIPSDSASVIRLQSQTDRVGSVFWYAAWTMVDYKLKVAPWANPLKTFLALEGALRALLQCFSTDQPTSCSSVPTNAAAANFHNSSGLSLANQTWPRHLKQSHFLILFLGYLERVIANATAGFAFAIPRPVSPACSFFSTNEATCTQWFNRVRGLIVRIAGAWPLVPSTGLGLAVESSATVVFHFYSLFNSSTDAKSADTNWRIAFSRFSDDVLIHAARSLYHLSAWEELYALADWAGEWATSDTNMFNPFGWLTGLGYLARGYWDDGLKTLREFITTWIDLRSSLPLADYQALLNGRTETNLAYATELLLRCYLDEGNYKAASELQHTLQPTDNQPLPDALRSTIRINWARLDCFSKLSSWTDLSHVETQALPKSDLTTWPSRTFPSTLDTLLAEAAVAHRHMPFGDVLSAKLQKLVTHIRQASTAMYTSSCIGYPCVSDVHAHGDDGLCSWLTLADILLKSRTQDIEDCDLAGEPANFVAVSSWCHLLSGRQLRINSANISLQSCRWALSRQSPALAQRLLLRESHNLVPNGSPNANQPDLRSIYNLTRTNSFCETERLSQLQRLRFSSCLAELLWLNDQSSGDACAVSDNKLAAIDVLCRGLRTALLDEVTQDTRQHATRCKMSVEVSFRLFEWLNEASTESAMSWADVVHRQASEQTMSSKLMKTSTIANHLNFFSRLVDEPWANGLPLIPPGNFSAPGRSSSRPSSHTTWTSRLLMMATRLSPSGSSTKAWLRMADWCFTRGQSLIEETQAAAKSLLESSIDSDTLTTASGRHPKKLLLDMLQPEERKSVCSSLREHLSSLNSAALVSDEVIDDHLPRLIACLTGFMVFGADGTETTVSESSSSQLDIERRRPLRFYSICPDEKSDEFQMIERLRSHLHSILPAIFPSPTSISLESARYFRQLVTSLTHRQYGFHTSAAQAYATFLTVAGQQTSPTDSPATSEDYASKLDTTTAILKLLDLLSAPSRALRNLIAGFLMHGAPSAHSFDLNLSLSGDESASTTVPGTQTSERRITSRMPPYLGTTLGGPSMWEVCLPQALVRLSLPDPIIRRCLVALLQRLIFTGSQSVGYGHPVSHDSKYPSSPLRFAAHLVFPAVVAVLDANRLTFTRGATKPDASTVGDIIPSSVTSASCFTEIIDALQSAGFTSLVHQVELFVSELQRITLLWEELWLGTLSQHLEELTKKLALLESEIKRSVQFFNSNPSTVAKVTTEHIQVANSKCHSHASPHRDALFSNQSELSVSHVSTDSVMPDESTQSAQKLQRIIALKFLSIAQPTLSLLSQLSALTLEVQPETPHEEWFQRTFGPMISELRESLTNPVDVMDAKAPLGLMRHLISQLQSVHHWPDSTRVAATIRPNELSTREQVNYVAPARSSFSSILYFSLHHLSPRLARMRFGCESDCLDSVAPDRQTFGGIPLPGRFELQSVRLSSRIAVLPTKTRPKRLVFCAENGHSYPYLLKGLEDLRLDDRVMRLFELVNLAMAELSGAGAVHVNQICARTYAVTPLGVRAGLLQMVQGATPLFSLYKRWQMRASKLDSDLPLAPSSGVMQIPRPGELFHARLKDFLINAGLPYHSHARSSWPLETLREVLLSLEAETPADLLSREIWASNPSSASWWHASRTFARSAGLMSIIGYLVGLGDRHLDNLLVDLTTGHLIHIDYNVCFDKGRTLRVAERVPFRLTRILRHALGPLAGDFRVRGTFRTAAEEALQLVRTVSDPFLIQLKGFLIDPLVDWQCKRPMSSAQSSAPIVVTDFTHLSAYMGGGSSTTHKHQIATHLRKLHRINAESRLYVGLIATRLYEMCHTRSLQTVHSALEQVIDRLRTWDEWRLTDSEASIAKRSHRTLTDATTSELDLSEKRCRASEAAYQNLLYLQDSLSAQLRTWSADAEALWEAFKQLDDPTWLPSVLLCSDVPELVNTVSRYYSIARVYLSHPSLRPTQECWMNHVISAQSSLSVLVRLQPITAESIQACTTHLESLQQAPVDLATDYALIHNLEKAIHEQECLIEQLKGGPTDAAPSGSPALLEWQVVIRPELDNLHLFLYDQGSLGLMAYCWALIDYLPNVVASVLNLETDPHSWHQCNDTSLSDLPCNYLDQLTMYAECLTGLFSVLHHPQTGTLHFTAGFEADVRRELAFFLSIRDVCLCLSRLYSNLTRLLLPEAIDALMVNAVGDLAEDFSKFVARHLTDSNVANLSELVGTYLKTYVITNSADGRLHQILIAVHLALTNTTAQLEEIALRIRAYPITAPAWYYVDLMAQATATLLSRCSGWHDGATCLWGWEPSGGCDTHTDSTSPCSWLDEVYASGLMAFVSLLDENRSHWQALQLSSTDVKEDIILTPFSRPADRFIGRLISRTALASLTGLALGRLYCALIENTGVSIRRLVLESDALTKTASGITTPVLTNITSDKLTETACLHLSVIRPVGVQHLRGPASNLIHRLADRAGEAGDRWCRAKNLELAEKNLVHLTTTLAVIRWTHSHSSLPRMPVEINGPVQSPLVPDIVDVLEAIQKSLSDVTSSAEQPSPSVQALVQVAKAICFFERLRIGHPEACSYSKTCRNLLEQLNDAMQLKLSADTSLIELDKILLSLKDQYKLQWPARAWLSGPCVSSDHGALCTLSEQLNLNVTNAATLLKSATRQLYRIRSELRSLDHGSVPNHPLSEKITTNSVVPGRLPHKRQTRHSQQRAMASSPVLPTSPSLPSTHAENQSALITALRVALTTLQCEFLSEIRQSVKMLSRYDAARSSLTFCENSSSQQISFWSSWLEAHQSWITCALQLIKQLTQFVRQSANDESSEERTDPGSCLRSEANEACRILAECRSLQSRVWTELLSPLITAVRQTLNSDEGMSRNFRELLSNLECHLLATLSLNPPLPAASSTELQSSTGMPTPRSGRNSRGFALPTPLPYTGEPVNLQALSIWCLIRNRLMGLDPTLNCSLSGNFEPNDDRRVGGTTCMSVREQVDVCIRSATDIDNLALMYEGWTAWV
ncbi:unnamed protein product [Dicrocoelium dendriticum]|nr:unnamed protein product [Dicrocoelium dendriticum]